MIIYEDNQLVIPVGIGTNVIDNSLLLQDKTVTISENGVTMITPDSSFHGLSKVKVFTDVPVDVHNQSKRISITENGRTTVTPDLGFTGLDRVVIDTSVETGSYSLEDKTIDVTTNNFHQNYYPRYPHIGFSSVSVNVDIPYKTKDIVIDSSTVSQYFPGTDTSTYRSITVNPYKLDYKTVDSSTVSQLVTSDYDGLKSVIVNPYRLDSSALNVTQNGLYKVTSQADGLSEVDINVMVEGTFVYNQDKTVDSSTAVQQITYDELYTGLGTVTINPYILDTKSITVTENGNYSVDSSADGLSRVDVSVNIDTSSYYDAGYLDGEVAGIAYQKSLLDSSLLTANGTYYKENGWNRIDVSINTVNNQNITVDSSSVSQTVVPDANHTGLGQVTINPYRLEVKNTAMYYQYLPDDIDASTVIVTPSAGYDGISSISITNTPILASKTFVPKYGRQTWSAYDDTDYLYGVNQVVIEGISSVLQHKYVEPSTNSITVVPDYAQDKYGLTDVLVMAVTHTIDSNIVPVNIKKDVTILGVTGTYVPTVNNQDKTIDSSTARQVVTYDSSYDGLNSVTVRGYNIDASYIRLSNI